MPAHSAGPLLPVCRDALGSIIVGDRLPSIAGVGTVALPGAIVSVDPARPDRLPRIAVADPDLAVDWLGDLLGADVVAAVGRLAESGEPDPSPIPVATSPTPLVGELVDLGVLQWLDVAAPWPLDEPVLELETALRRAALTSALGVDDEPLPLRPELVDAVVAALSSTLPQPDPLVLLLREAAGELLFHLPVIDLVRHRIDAALAAPPHGPGPAPGHAPAAADRRAIEALVAEVLPPAASPESLADGARRGQPTSAAAAAAAGGQVGIDWRFVRRGLAGRRESAVSWAIDAGTSGALLRVEVEVAAQLPSWLPGAARPVRRPPHLECAAYLQDRPRPVALGRLTPAAETGLWVGRLPMRGLPAEESHPPGGLGHDLLIVVHEPGREPTGLSPTDRAAATARRWASRALTAARLATASTASPDHAANREPATVGALAAAARLAFAASAGAWDGVPGAAAAACARRCRELADDAAAGSRWPRVSVTERLRLLGSPR